jgi:hypothetical protein
MPIFDNPIPLRRGGDKKQPYDWVCRNGLKIKHIASSTIVDDYHRSPVSNTPIPYWQYAIRRNQVPDYFILSAWDNRESLTPMYIWIIKGHEDFRTQTSNRPFWGRMSWNVYATKKGIARMDKYQMINKLEELKSVCIKARDGQLSTSQ